MRYLSVCSGIEAATVAWRPLGWWPVAFSEIEAFPSAVLAHHYPDVPNLGDMTNFRSWPDAAIDLLVGGTPCQSFSVAGLRKGLDDPRGNLALTYLAIAERYRPRWLVWENVPGVLSINGGRDFGAFVGALGQLGYGWAYRVLDAQYFGVAQRRRRVFVVGCLGDWRRAAAVLFERHSLSGHPAPRREAGEEPAKSLTRGAAQRFDAETETMIPVAHTLRCEAVAFNWQGGGTQTSLGYDPEAGVTGSLHVGQTPAVALALRGREGGATAEVGDDCAFSLRASTGGGDKPHVMVGMAVRRLTPRECERLQGFPDDYTRIPTWNGWRDLDACETPEGLMAEGFKVKQSKKTGRWRVRDPDGPRYKALGNSMAVPVMRWIGERIEQVHEIASKEAAA